MKHGDLRHDRTGAYEESCLWKRGWGAPGSGTVHVSASDHGDCIGAVGVAVPVARIPDSQSTYVHNAVKSSSRNFENAAYLFVAHVQHCAVVCTCCQVPQAPFTVRWKTREHMNHLKTYETHDHN